jgi:biotin transport system substrate-specific component
MALSIAFITVCSWISIPLTVPVTLQIFAIFLISIMLGFKGTLAILIYILLGALGVPVFSGFAGGFGVLLGNTGGYIIGFIFSSIAISIITKFFGNKTITLIVAMLVALIICYAFGTAWFMYFYTKNTGAIGLSAILLWCVVPFIVPDIAKIILVLMVVKRIPKIQNYKLL